MTSSLHTTQPVRLPARRLTTAVLAWVGLTIGCSMQGCQSTGGAPGGSGDQQPPVPASWKLVMRGLDKEIDTLHKALGDAANQDLVAAAAAARRGAGLIQHGYGKFENSSIEGFAKLARDCESWFLAIATEAGQGRAAMASELLSQTEVHCVRCHEAADQ